MEDEVKFIDPQNYEQLEEIKKLYEEIDKEILRTMLVPKDMLELCEMPNLTPTNYARQYAMYGVPVIADPTKIYVLKPDIPEGKKQKQWWYVRLWKSIKNMFKHETI